MPTRASRANRVAIISELRLPSTRHRFGTMPLPRDSADQKKELVDTAREQAIGAGEARTAPYRSQALFAQTASHSTATDTRADRLSLGRWVDAFSHVMYDVGYRSEGGRLSEVLRVYYADGVTIDIDIGTIGDATASEVDVAAAIERATVGLGGRVFPPELNRGTTPRLWAAKQSALEAMGEYNAALVSGTLPAVVFVITMGFAAPGTRPPTSSRQRLAAPVALSKPGTVTVEVAVSRGLVPAGRTLARVLKAIQDRFVASPSRNLKEGFRVVEDAVESVDLEVGFAPAGQLAEQSYILLKNIGDVYTRIMQSGEIVVFRSDGTTLLRLIP